MSILSMSHTDLDGIGCQIILRQTFGEITRMNLSYNKVDEYLEILEDYCIHNRPQKVFITDLSFNEQQMNTLTNITRTYNDILFYFIDHHPAQCNYENLSSANFVILVTDKACATKLVYLYCKANFGLVNEDLGVFVEYVNAYDIWLTDKPEFKVGLVYNDIFWEYRIKHFWNRFKDDFKLRNSDKEKFKELMIKKRKVFGKLENSGRMFKLQDQKIFMIFLDDFKNHITLDYPDYNIYVMVSSYGGFSVRLRNDFAKGYPFKDNVVNSLLSLQNIGNAGGHHAAFGGNLIDSSAHKQVEFAKQILTIIDAEQDLLLSKT